MVKAEIKEVFSPKKEESPKSQICSSCLATFETEGKKSKETFKKQTLYTAQHPQCKDEYVRIYFTDPYSEVQSNSIDSRQK